MNDYDYEAFSSLAFFSNVIYRLAQLIFLVHWFFILEPICHILRLTNFQLQVTLD
jgi:hypothetical protein